MDNLKQRSIELFKMEKASSYCADKLNITEAQYKKLKKKFYKKENLKRKKVKFFSKAAENAQIVNQ